MYVAILAIGVALGIRVVVDGYSPVPFGDFWAQFSFLERGVRGDFGLGDLWAQWNEHRIFLSRIHFLLDYWLFDGTNVFLFVAIATSCLLLAVTFATAVWIDSRDWLLALGTLAVAGTSALPLAGIENLTISFEVHFVQVFLFATVSILAVVVAARSVASRRAIWSSVAAIAAVAATYSMANGLFTWVVVVLLAIVLRLERRLTAALAIVGAVTIATFLWHFESSTGGSLSDPVGLVHFVALYLGSALTPSPATAAIVGAAGLVLFPLLCRLVWVGRSGGAAVVPFGAGVAAFVVLTSASTAVGRLEDFGTSQALASRYSIGSFTFWLGLFVGFLPTVRERLRSVPIAVPAYLGGAAVVALVLGYQTIPPSSELRAVIVGREATVVAYRAGVEDASNSVPNVQGGPGVTSALRWMERERLGPWAPGGMVDAMRVAGPSNRTDRACLGEIESAEPVRGGSRLRGWIATPDGETSSRNPVVLDAGGRRSGLGLVGMQRPDVEPPGADAEWTGFVAYVRGKPAVPLEVVLLAEDGANAVCRLTWAGGRRD